MSLFYHPFYCEENVWHLSGDPCFQGLEIKIVFISNPTRTCAMWHMKAADKGPVIWDYHVILLSPNHGWRVWDLDSRLGCPANSKIYLKKSFRKDWPDVFLPMFRVVDGPIFREIFSSDRSHMIQPGEVLPQDPPAWPKIYNGVDSNLWDFVDMENQSFPGEIMDMNAFEAYLET